MSGIAYGPAACVVMNYVVIPLFAAPHGPRADDRPQPAPSSAASRT